LAFTISVLRILRFFLDYWSIWWLENTRLSKCFRSSKPIHICWYWCDFTNWSITTAKSCKYWYILLDWSIDWLAIDWL